MSDYETPPPDADRTITDFEDALDPEAPSDSELVNPPKDDADRTVPAPDDSDVIAELQDENAATSLDQPSDSTS